MTSIQKIVVLGANSAMGAGAGGLFASVGISTVFLARTLEHAEAGKAWASQLAGGRLAPGAIRCGAYTHDLVAAVADADLVFEAVSEDPLVQREAFELIEPHLHAHTIVATGSSRSWLAGLCEQRSARFTRNFLGIHLFGAPAVSRGCELIAHRRTDPRVVASVREFLTTVVEREVVETADTPGFAGHRLAFRVLNEVAQLAEEHGVAFMDQLVGPHTGRALPPLATIDLVGWGVHKAIVDNLHLRTYDAAHDRFVVPAYMRRHGDCGRFFVTERKGAGTHTLVLDPRTGAYRPQADAEAPPPSFVERMKRAIGSRRDGGYREAMEVLCTARGRHAELLRRVVLGYISYGLGMVGHVVVRPRDLDRIMGFGFNWAPPSVLVDAIGPVRTIRLLEGAQLPVPAAIVDAARHQRALFDEPRIDRGQFFVVAA